MKVKVVLLTIFLLLGCEAKLEKDIREGTIDEFEKNTSVEKEVPMDPETPPEDELETSQVLSDDETILISSVGHTLPEDLIVESTTPNTINRSGDVLKTINITSSLIDLNNPKQIEIAIAVENIINLNNIRVVEHVSSTANSDIAKVYSESETVLDCTNDQCHIKFNTELKGTSYSIIELPEPISVESVSTTVVDGGYALGLSLPVIVKFTGKVVLADGGQIELTFNVDPNDPVPGELLSDNQVSFPYVVKANHLQAALNVYSESSLSVEPNGALVDDWDRLVSLTLPTKSNDTGSFISSHTIAVDGFVPDPLSDIGLTKNLGRIDFAVADALPDSGTGLMTLLVTDNDQLSFVPINGVTYTNDLLPTGLSVIDQGSDDFADTGLANGVERTYLIFVYDQVKNYSASFTVSKAPGMFWKHLDASTVNTCGLTSDNDVYCWGGGYVNGLGSNTDSALPQKIAAPTDYSANKWVAISIADDHGCAIAETGASYCWGAQYSGGLGNGQTSSAGIYTADRSLDPAGFSGKWLQVEAGDFFNCGIDDSFKAYCTGRADFGILGNAANGSTDSGTYLKVDDPTGFSGKWAQVSAGHVNSCGVDDAGSGYCWGFGSAGVIGVSGHTTHQFSPKEVDDPTGFSGKWKAIYPAVHYACGIDDAGKAYCWGDEWNGCLGNGGPDASVDSPVPVSGDLVFDHLGRNGEAYFVCGLESTDKKVYCWGWNNNSEVGVDSGVSTAVHEPSLVNVPGIVTRVNTGEYHSCAVNSEGDAYCWGGNWEGQLGNNDTTGTHIPQKVLDPLN